MPPRACHLPRDAPTAADGGKETVEEVDDEWLCTGFISPFICKWEDASSPLHTFTVPPVGE